MGLPAILFFAQRSPAQAERICRVVILALIDVNFATGVKPEDLVVKVFTLDDHVQAMIEPHVHLRIQLEVRIKVNVAGGSLQAEIRGIGRRHELVLINHGAVVSHSHMDRKALVVVAWANIEGVRRLALEGRRVGSARQAMGLRIRVGIVRSDAESRKRPGQSTEMLEVCEFNSADVCVRPIDD